MVFDFLLSWFLWYWMLLLSEFLIKGTTICCNYCRGWSSSFWTRSFSKCFSLVASRWHGRYLSFLILPCSWIFCVFLAITESFLWSFLYLTIAFFAAVEIRDNPELKGKPVAVGGLSMIATTSYEARKFGVRAAMPGFIGKVRINSFLFIFPHNLLLQTTPPFIFFTHIYYSSCVLTWYLWKVTIENTRRPVR